MPCCLKTTIKTLLYDHSNVRLSPNMNSIYLHETLKNVFNSLIAWRSLLFFFRFWILEFIRLKLPQFEAVPSPIPHPHHPIWKMPFSWLSEKTQKKIIFSRFLHLESFSQCLRGKWYFIISKWRHFIIVSLFNSSIQIISFFWKATKKLTRKKGKKKKTKLLYKLKTNIHIYYNLREIETHPGSGIYPGKLIKLIRETKTTEKWVWGMKSINKKKSLKIKSVLYWSFILYDWRWILISLWADRRPYNCNLNGNHRKWSNQSMRQITLNLFIIYQCLMSWALAEMQSKSSLPSSLNICNSKQ